MMVKLGRSNVITIVMQVLTCWCCFKQSKGQTYTISGPSYAVKGESYRFTCNIVGGNLPGAVKFIRDTVDYCGIFLLTCSANDGIYSCGCVNNNNNTLYLNIPDVKTTDEGGWTCAAFSGGGVSNTITLPVYYGPENMRLDPVGSSIIVREGTSKTVTCSADCKPSCGFKWYKTNTEIVSTSQLILNNRSQAGSYRCEARHLTISTDPLIRYLEVTVYYGPDSVILDPSSVGEVVEGDDMTPVRCSAECNPTCNINWSFSGSSIPTSNGVLQLTNMNRTQHGTYTCQIQNSQIPELTKSKTLKLTVNYPPIITRLTSTNREVYAGSSVTFTCSSDSRPNATINWSTSLNTNIAGGNIYINPDVSCLHTDNYTCSANNDVGSVSKSIPLFVKCSPRLRDGIESEVTNRIGQTVALEVDVLAYPEPTFSWIKNNTVAQSKIVELSANNYISTLQIKLQSSSFGVYTVNVKNGVGEKQFYIVVIDEGSPDTPSLITECATPTTWIVVGCILGLIVGSCFGMIGVLMYLRRLNLHCNQTKKNSDTAAVKYDVVGAGDVNNYDGINMTESIDNQTSPVYTNQTTNPGRPAASGGDAIGRSVGNEGSNPVNTYDNLTTAYTNENSYETL